MIAAPTTGETFVVVGGGVGGGTAALALRSGGFPGRLVVVCDEPRAPYSRPPLSKEVLRGEQDAERTALRPLSWYAKRDIELITGVAATELDPAARTVRLSDGTTLTYDKLLLATGGRARTLPGAQDLPGAFTLRTVTDALAISERLVHGARVVVVGGGFVGSEVAASAVRLGCSVTVLEGQQVPLERVLPPTLGQLLLRLHRERGVDVRTGIAITHLEAGHDGGPVASAASGEQFPADVVVVGIGIVADDGLAVRAGLQVEDGVVVDEHLRTSDPDVFAIGDVANAPHPLLGERGRVEHWQNAQHQAKVAAKNMLGGDEVFAEVPWVWSDQYDVTIEIVGRPRPTDEVHLRGDVDGWRLSTVLTRDGVLCGCVSFNRPDDARAVRTLMTERHPVSLQELTHPETDLVALVSRART